MRHSLVVTMISLLAVAAAGTAFAAPAFTPRLHFPEAQPNPYATTTFDLGVDVSDVPLTRQGVNQFLQTLTPEGQEIMQATCRNYVGDPIQVRSQMTISFCQVLLGQ
jgi:hypothetical protein